MGEGSDGAGVKGGEESGTHLQQSRGLFIKVLHLVCPGFLFCTCSLISNENGLSLNLELSRVGDVIIILLLELQCNCVVVILSLAGSVSSSINAWLELWGGGHMAFNTTEHSIT